MTADQHLTIDRFDVPHFSGEGVFKISVGRSGPMPDDTTDAPILFVTDGNMAFDVALGIARFATYPQLIPSLLVVAIGYDATDFAAFAKLRTPDLTPPMSEEARKQLLSLAHVIGDSDGRADAFAAFIKGVLTPEIVRRYPQTANGKRALFGHSLGGLFTAHTLLANPGAFDAFLASSPSLWWDDFSIFKRIDGLSERVKALPTPPRAFVAVGSKEQDMPDHIPPELGVSLEDARALVTRSRMVDAAREFAEALQTAGLPNLEHAALQGEDHTTAVPPALMRAILVAFGKPKN